MTGDKYDEFIQSCNDLEEFIKLTSDEVIRLAAYPDAEWVENGGKLTAAGFLGGAYNARLVSDEPPVIETTSGNLYNALLERHKLAKVKQNLDKRKANIAAHWKKLKAHSCYKRFHGYADNRLQFAVKIFEKKAKRNDAPNTLKSDLALFRFYHLFAQYIESYLIFDKYGQPQKYADKKVLDKAKGHVEKLQADFSKGLRLNNNHHQLDALLKQLSIEIVLASRKKRETPTAAKRRALEALAYRSIYEFGEASATILGHFAVILGWDNHSNSTMDDIVATAKEKHQQATKKLEREKAKKLAEALRQPPP
jgi:hypothetical protein